LNANSFHPREKKGDDKKGGIKEEGRFPCGKVSFFGRGKKKKEIRKAGPGEDNKKEKSQTLRCSRVIIPLLKGKKEKKNGKERGKSVAQSSGRFRYEIKRKRESKRPVTKPSMYSLKRGSAFKT